MYIVITVMDEDKVSDDKITEYKLKYTTNLEIQKIYNKKNGNKELYYYSTNYFNYILL